MKTPGFFAFLHTFGRDLKWHPHIHVLIAEIALCSNGAVIKHEYFDYNALSRRFQKILLDLLEKEIGPSFKKVKAECYRKYNKGFYIHAPKKDFKNLKETSSHLQRRLI